MYYKETDATGIDGQRVNSWDLFREDELAKERNNQNAEGEEDA